MAINLLPKDLIPGAGFIKSAGILRRLVTLGFAVFVIIAMGIVGFFIFNSLSIRNSDNKQSELKNSIKSLEQTEQGMVLVKDRIGKVQQVNALPSSAEESANLSTIFSQASGLGTLTEAIIEKEKLDTTFSVSSSSALTQLLATIVTGENYKRVELMSFSFNPNVGYLVSLAFVTK